MNNHNIAQYLKSALELEKTGEYKSALEQYKKILGLDQNNFQAWLNAGSLYSKIHKSEKAIICYAQALKQKESEIVYYNLGTEYFKLHQFTDSMKVVKKCLEQNPQFLSAYLLLAVIADQLGQFKVASDSIENLLRFEPNHRGAHTAMIVLCIKNKAHDMALRYLDKLTVLGERKQVIDQLKSKLFLSKGDVVESIQLFQIMSRENPELKKIVKNLKEELPSENRNIIHAKKNQINKKINKKGKDWLDLSLISLFEGDGEEAMNHLKKVVD